MGIDNETVPTSINIVFDDNGIFLEELRKQAIEDGQNEGKDDRKLSLTDENKSFDTDEYYYDE